MVGSCPLRPASTAARSGLSMIVDLDGHRGSAGMRSVAAVTYAAGSAPPGACRRQRSDDLGIGLGTSVDPHRAPTRPAGRPRPDPVSATGRSVAGSPLIAPLRRTREPAATSLARGLDAPCVDHGFGGQGGVHGHGQRPLRARGSPAEAVASAGQRLRGRRVGTVRRFGNGPLFSILVRSARALRTTVRGVAGRGWRTSGRAWSVRPGAARRPTPEELRRGGPPSRWG